MPALRGTLLAALLALACAATAAAAPSVERLEVVTARAATGDGGNAWGGHQPRVTVTRDGVFTAYSVDLGRGPLQRGWRLARRSATGWRVIASGRSGREPPSLVARPSGALVVVAWPDGLPRRWTVRRANGRWAVTERAVPGDWVRSDWPYAGAAVDRRGRLSVLQSTMTDLRLAVEGRGGNWTSAVEPTIKRYTYGLLTPQPDGSLDVFATRSMKWAESDYVAPEGAFDYVYDSVGSWRTNAAGRAALVSGPTISRVRQASRANPAIYTAAVQTLVDDEGLTHVMYAVNNWVPGGCIVMRHAVLRGDRLLADRMLPLGYVYTRVVQNAKGELFVVGIGGEDLTILPLRGPLGLDVGEETRISLGRRTLRNAGFMIADGRSGTKPSDTVHVVYPTGREGGTWMHLALDLR